MGSIIHHMMESIDGFLPKSLSGEVGKPSGNVLVIEEIEAIHDTLWQAGCSESFQEWSRKRI